VNYTNWEDGQPLFDEGEGHAIKLGSVAHKMLVEKTSYPILWTSIYSLAHYICEKNTNFVDGPRNDQMKWKSCSAGSDWTCRNEVVGCYCHQTIKVSSSFFLFDNPRTDLFNPIDRGIGRTSALCKSIGMKLVSIETAAEQLLLASGLQENDGNSQQFSSFVGLQSTGWWTSGSKDSGLPVFKGNSQNNFLHSLVFSGHLIHSSTRHDGVVDFRIRGQRRPVVLDGYWTRNELHQLGL
jgi:hypothetical protein